MREGKITGGCLCGAVRYEAEEPPIYAGCCYCRDCQRQSGSAFIPFMGIAASQIRITGQTRVTVAKSVSGGDAHRNFCAACGSLVFGAVVGEAEQHTIYCGTLDDLADFTPTMVIFNQSRPAWAPLPEGVTVFERMPGG